MNWFLITDKDFDGALISNVEDSNGVLIRNIGVRRKDISSGRIATTRERERERERFVCIKTYAKSFGILKI